MLIILSLPKIKSLSLSFRAKVKPIISHYYSHTNRSTESTTWSRSGVFSDSPCFHHSVNPDQCQIILTYFVTICSNFILKLVNMQGFIQVFWEKDPGQIGKKNCRRNVEIGKNILTKHIKLEAYSTIMNI